MNLIKVHCHGLLTAINVEYISGVRERDNGGSYIFMTREMEPWEADESFETVIDSIAAFEVKGDG